MSYSLRVYQRNKKGEYTNTHLKMFDSNDSVSITPDDFATIDWPTCVFQVYPADAQTQSFYPLLKPQYSLRLVDTKNGAIMGETRFSDQYIYFKPESPLETYTFQLSIQKSLGPEIK